MKTNLALLVALALSGCAHSIIPTHVEYKVAMPESKYFECEKVDLPDPKTLTDAQLAELINQLVKANRLCANNIVAIKQYLNAAKDVLETRKN